MAKALDSTGLASIGWVQTRSLHFLQTFRLASGLTIVLGSIVSMVGVSWDIQWHTFVGRDRTLIPPHLMMLSGIALAGLAALLVVALETAWARRQPEFAARTTRFADFFYAPLGAYIAGFTALAAAIAFPLDSYWHALYGIDVRIWAPFHVMILSAGAMIPFGAAFLLNASASLGTETGARSSTRLARLGMVLAFAAVLGIFTFLLGDATDDPGFMQLGSVIINFFPPLSGLLVSWVLVGASRLIPWRWAATAVVLAYLFYAVIFQIFVPPATGALVAAEHLTYRRELGSFAVLSLLAVRFWPLMPLIVAPLIDIFARRASRKSWSGRKTLLAFALVSLISCFPLFVLEPTWPVLIVIYLGPIGFLISLAMGFGGTLLGSWLALRQSSAISSVEGR